MKSALNRIRPTGQHNPRKSPRKGTDDVFGPRKPRPPYDPHKPLGADTRGASPRSPRAGAPARKPARAPARVADLPKPAHRAAARALLEAMQVEAFVEEFMAYACVPAALAQVPDAMALQEDAMDDCFAGDTVPPRAVLERAVLDMCHTFSEATLNALVAFAATRAGGVMFADLPRLRLRRKYGAPLAIAAVELDAFHAEALRRCLRAVDPDLERDLGDAAGNDAHTVWPGMFTPGVVLDLAIFLKSPAGRAFANYQRHWPLGMPPDLLLQRHTWVRSVQSRMVTLLEEAGGQAPPPWGNIPVYVPSRVKIEELPA